MISLYVFLLENRLPRFVAASQPNKQAKLATGLLMRAGQSVTVRSACITSSLQLLGLVF